MVTFNKKELAEYYVKSLGVKGTLISMVEDAFLTGFDATKKLIPCEESMPEDCDILRLPEDSRRPERTQEVICRLENCFTIGFREKLYDEWYWVLDLDAEIEVISWRPIYDYL